MGGRWRARDGRVSAQPLPFRNHKSPAHAYAAMVFFDPGDGALLMWLPSPTVADRAAVLGALGPADEVLELGLGWHAGARQHVRAPE